MRKIRILITISFLLYSLSSIQAGEVRYALKGKKELSMIGSMAFFSWTEHGDKYADGTSVILGLNLGYFVVDKFEVEPGLILFTTTINPEVEKSHTETHFGGIFALSYNFDTGSPAVPFLFGRIGFLTNSITDEEDLKTSTILPDVGGGVKLFFSPNAAMRTEIYYNHLTNLLGEEDESQNLYGLRAGLSILFK